MWPGYLMHHWWRRIQIGIDCVGLGSDFDGTRIPQAIGDVAGLPKLIAALREHGYDEAALRKLAYENWVRVLNKTWKHLKD
jgi:membrane dipeptidase